MGGPDHAQPGYQVLSLSEFDSKLREYKKRRSHKKTTSGCLACKTKRVKCDESKPICLRCQRNSRSCSYGNENNSGKGLSLPEQAIELSAAGSFSVLSATTVIPFSSPSAKNGTPSIHLIQHLQRHWADIFPMPGNEEITSLFKSNPLVRNTILAVTACHLRHVSPGILQHRIAEHFQQSLALEYYQNALETPRDILGQSGVNALMLSAALLNLLAFALPDCGTAGSEEDNLDSSTPWVFSTRTDRLGWLALQVGIKPLVLSMAPHLDKTMAYLSKIFIGSETESLIFTRTGPGLDGIPEKWIGFFELDDASSGCGNMRPGDEFRAPAVLLAKLRHVKPIHTNVFKNLQFFGKVHKDFRQLLYDRNEKALWLFGYWLGLMCRFQEMWWSEKRAKRDYMAIGVWLELRRLTERPGAEGEKWRQLMDEYYSAPVFDRT